MAEFDDYSARQIARSTRNQLRRPRSETPARATPPTIAFTPVFMYVTQQVGIMSGSTLGKGKGRRFVLSYNSTNDATIDNPSTVDYWIYSAAKQAGAEIAIGRTVLCIPIGGRFHVINDYCT